MKMWSLRVIILLLFCYACLSSRIGNVRVVSTNFHLTLQWDAAETTVAGRRPLYTVGYKTYDDNSMYKPIAECQNIIALTCDLTAQTKLDYNEHYMARVMVGDQLHGYTMRFKPIAHTHLGPPVLSVEAPAPVLHVNITLPLGPSNVSVSDIIKGYRNSPFQTEVIYTLQITEPAWAAHTYENTTGRFDISLGTKADKICGFVVYRPSSEMGRHRSDKAPFCVPVQHEEGSPLRFLPWLLVATVLLGGLLTLAAFCTCHYVKGGTGVDTPETLKITPGAEPRVMQPQYCLPVAKWEVGPLTEKLVVPRPPLPSDGYCPQDVPSYQPASWNPNSSSSSSSSRQSSIIYSTFDVQKQEEGFPQSEGGTLPVSPREIVGSGPESRLPEPSDGSPGWEPQVVDARRGADGKLVLQLEQERPLLPNFELWRAQGTRQDSIPSSEDSGCDDTTLNTPTQPYCNSHYCPSGPQSGYKPNWVPENFHPQGRVCEDTRTHYARTWTGHKHSEDDEEDEALPAEELGSPMETLSILMIQVQD